MTRERITKEEFEKGYIERSHITKEWYDKYYVTLPCACGAKECQGWAKVRNTIEDIRDQMTLYVPKGVAR